MTDSGGMNHLLNADDLGGRLGISNYATGLQNESSFETLAKMNTPEGLAAAMPLIFGMLSCQRWITAPRTQMESWICTTQ